MPALDLTPPPFDPADWLAFAFGDSGSVEIAVLDEEEHIACTFSPERAVALGTRLIAMAHDINTIEAMENGTSTGLASILAKYEVDRTDQVYAAMMRQAIHEEVIAAQEDMFGPVDDTTRLVIDPETGQPRTIRRDSTVDDALRNLDV